MIIQFQTDSAFKSGLTLLHSYNFIFDLYRSKQMLKFFTEEMINNAKLMLSSRSLMENEDYSILSYEELDSKEL